MIDLLPIFVGLLFGCITLTIGLCLTKEKQWQSHRDTNIFRRPI